MLDVVARICDLSSPVAIWEVQMSISQKLEGQLTDVENTEQQKHKNQLRRVIL